MALKILLLAFVATVAFALHCDLIQGPCFNNECAPGYICFNNDTCCATNPYTDCFDDPQYAEICQEHPERCNDPTFSTAWHRQCRHTCQVCNEQPNPTNGPNPGGNGCVDIAPNCVQNKQYCTDPLYHKLMTQKCAKTCEFCN